MYKIRNIQDVSRPICKRYVAHVDVDVAGKTSVKRMIETCTERVKKQCSPAHVVWLYVYHDKKLLCRTAWVDKEFTDAPLPLPLDYNDHEGDIGIVWV